jgi:hypothetical protein
MPDTTRSPAQVLTQAINRAHAAGIPITTSRRLGVTCSSSAAPHWERDGSGDAISPLAAVLLAEQTPLSHADPALCHVFGSAMTYHLGIEDGVEGLDPSENLQRGPDAQLYRDGWRLGVQVRLLLSTERCDGHNVRHPRAEQCPMCAAGIPVPRLAANDVTLPIALPPEV